MSATEDRPGDQDRSVLFAGHVLFAVLLVIGTVRAAVEFSPPVVPIVAAALTAAWYGLGAARAPRSTAAQTRLWLAGLVVAWLVLIVISGEFVWIAFLLAMLVWHLLPQRVALPVVVLVAVATVVAFGLHQGTWIVGAIVGPIVGIATAVVITEVYRRQRALSEERRRLLQELIATQQALADREREAGRLGERERLAREIHDTVGQSLASVALLLRAAMRPAKSADPQAERATQLTTALDTTLAALGETRRFVRGLDPEAFDNRGLADVLAAAAAESTELGLPTQFESHGTPRKADTAVEVALLKAAQEALSNARKHSRATHATVTLTFQSDEVSVDVVDDGVGFDPSTMVSGRADGSGYGLTSMRTRIAERGGETTIESEPGGGTAVRATVPLARQS
ncbi:sensor histidine kinase [Antrihabitans cavernicola]|nr:ATP-binding protein [Spelaeibacter cavernicola]